VAATPVIFHTAGYHNREAQALARACGVLHLISKPADLGVIWRTVDSALAERVQTPLPAPTAEFDREHLRLLTDRLAQEVNDQRLVNARLTALLDVSRELVLEHDPHWLLEKCCRAARDLLGARHAAVGLLDGERQRFQPFLTCGWDPRAAGAGALSPRVRLLRRLLTAGQPLRVTDLRADPGASGFPT